MFTKVTVETNSTFGELSNVKFEEFTKDRKGAILVEPVGDTVPIVRSTTSYSNPPQKFLTAHRIQGTNNLESKYEKFSFNSEGKFHMADRILYIYFQMNTLI